MPPTDEDGVKGSQSSFVPELRGRLCDTRDSMEARALRQQLDRVRTLQQRNDVMSGDRLLAARHEGSKPHSVRNYYKWLRAVAEGEAPAPSSAPPVPHARPRSRSLQLDASDVSMFTRAVPDTDRFADRCPSPAAEPAARKNKSVPRFDANSEDESVRNTPSLCVSPQQHRKPAPKKLNKRDTGKSVLSTKNSTNNVKVNSTTSNSAKSVRHDQDRKVIPDRGIVIKPKPGPLSSHRVLQPIKRQRSKSLDVDGAKFVAQAREFLSPSSTPVLPDISTDESDDSSSSSYSPADLATDDRVPVSILKKSTSSSSSKNGFKKAKSQYAVHVTFSDLTTTIPVGYSQGRRASIAEENCLLAVTAPRQNVHDSEQRSRCVSPPPPSDGEATTCVDDTDKSQLLVPGMFPGIRRNSLPPLSVTMSEIQAAGSDEDDGDLFKPVVDARMMELATDAQSPGSHKHAYVKSDSSDSSGDDGDEAQGTTATHSRSRPIAAPRSCFNVPRRSPVEDSDSEEEVRCQVVHSFTPRPRLRNKVLPSASSAIQCASGSV